jgi:transposase
MPRSHTSPIDQKTQCSADDLRDHLSVTELCQPYGVSRKTGYNWIDRYLTHGPQRLEERSRRPSTSPRHTPEHVVAERLDARRRHPSWGAKKRLPILRQRHPHGPWPARSTVCDILGRHARMHRTLKAETARPGSTGAPSTSSSPTSPKSSTMHVRTRRSTGGPQPPAMNPPPGRCLLNCHRLRTLTAARYATAAPMGASDGTVTGSTFHTSALEHMLALRCYNEQSRRQYVRPISRSLGSDIRICALL